MTTVKNRVYISHVDLVTLHYNSGYKATYLKRNDTVYLGIYHPSLRKGMVCLPVDGDCYAGVFVVEVVDLKDFEPNSENFEERYFVESGYTLATPNTFRDNTEG